MEIFVVAGAVLYLWTQSMFPKAPKKPPSAEESLGKQLKQIIQEAIQEAHRQEANQRKK